MSNFDSLLAPIDGAPPWADWTAIVRSLVTGTSRDMSIDLIHVLEPLPWYTRPFLPDADELDRARLDHWSRALEVLAGPLRRPGVEVRCQVAHGRPIEQIERALAEGRHDLLIKPTPSIDSGPVPALDAHLLRTAACPVWLVRPPEGVPRCVLAAIDPRPAAGDVDPLNLEPPTEPVRDELAQSILRTANKVACSLGAELHVVHVWSAPGEDLLQGESLLSADQVRTYVDAARRARLTAFERTIMQAGIDVPTSRRHFVKGSAEPVILERVETLGAGLVVMGTVARGGLVGLLGSTAEGVFRHAACSLLVIKPEALPESGQGAPHA